MRKVMFICLVFCSLSLCGQYTIGERSFSVGDTIVLDHGSAPTGEFQYVQLGGLSAAAVYNQNQGPEQFNISRNYSGFAVKIQKIKTLKQGVNQKTYFVVKLGINTCYVYIDDALKFGEIR
jgi:hypothetical protein